MNKSRALVLLSGGLDSTLAAALLLRQGIDVVGLSFKSCFFGPQKAEAAASRLGIPLRVVGFSSEHLDLVKNPPHGYGKAANPCLDCHTLMLQKASGLLQGRLETDDIEDQGSVLSDGSDRFGFIATGEVLGQRPFSQNKSALRYVEKHSGVAGYLLRPLCAKLLEPTIPEKEGLIDRDQLLDIRGRSRVRQQKLAEEFGLVGYPQPAGGCLLTEKVFGEKLKDMFARWPDCDCRDVSLLRLGRHFWLPLTPGGEANALIVLGRNENENRRLETLVRPGDVLVAPQAAGPSGLVRTGPQRVGEDSRRRLVEETKQLIVRYASKIRAVSEIAWETRLCA